jgi:hypothetical protein
MGDADTAFGSVLVLSTLSTCGKGLHPTLSQQILVGFRDGEEWG